METTPAIKQCTDPDDSQFGAVAVQADDNRWGVMNPRNGGHWATTAEVASWPNATVAAPAEGAGE